MYQNFIIPYLYEAQHVSGDIPPIIRSLKLHWEPLVFSYVEGCWTCSWWTLSCTYCAPDDGRCRPKHVELHIKLRGLSPRANYTDRAAAAGRRS